MAKTYRDVAIDQMIATVEEAMSPSRRIVVETTVAYVHAIDDGIVKRLAALDDPPAHGLDIVTHERAC